MIEVLTDTAETVLKRRYYLKDEEGNCIEDWPTLCHRVAKFIASATPESHMRAALEQKYFEGMYHLDWLPNTPALTNAGTDIGMLSACIVLGVEDSITGIFNAIRDAALCHKEGSGTGFSFSDIRAAGSRVKSTNGISSGPLSFIRVFNEATETIKQGSRRRGANLATLIVDHPDIEDFIDAKEDLTQFTNFNFSVGITDAFMDKVKYGCTDEVRILNKIVDRAWRTGEPGCLFLDTINKNSPVLHLGRISSSNPCQPHWTPVIKKDVGIVPLGSLNVGDEVWSKEGWTKVTMFESTGIKDVYSYSTTAGTFYSTENHEVVSGDSKIEVCNAESIDLCHTLLDDKITIDYQDVVDGLVIGDGTKHGRDGDRVVLLCIGAKDQDYFDVIPEFIGNEYSKPGTHKIKTTVSPDELPQTFDRYIPERFLYTNRSRIAGFLRGLFSANGTVILSPKTRRVQLKASSRTVIEQVQVMLLSLGIRSYVTTNKSKCIEFSNGTYRCKESYDINITSDVDIFHMFIGFIQKYKSDKLEEVVNYDRSFKGGKRNYNIYKSEYVNTEEVFHITVDNASHTYWSFGFDTGNCGEIPLLPGESCNLASINLSKFIIVDSLGDSIVDWQRLQETVEICVYFLNGVIDKNKYPIPIVEEMTKRTRKIGLGIMGLHDILIELQLPYASEEGREMAAKIMNFIEANALIVSEDLAENDGPFPGYDHDLCSYPPRRNATVTSIQPTGTGSMIANCSSGCEPNFSYVMVKNVMDETHLTMVNPLFEKVAKREGFYSDELLTKVGKTGSVLHPEIPVKWQEILRTASDISADDHVKMLCTLQNNGVQNAISKSINMPESATREDVARAYMMAWEGGAKGLTVYRNNSRSNQVLNTVGNLDRPTATVSADGPVKQDLPDTLRARRYKLKMEDGENIYLIICFSEDGKPMEVFSKFPYESRHEYRERTSTYTTVCRLISLALRYDVPVEEVIKQLDKASGSMFDLPAQLTKLLKTFLSETKNPYTVPCPECGEPTLVFEEGCQVCKSCGYSKCS